MTEQPNDGTHILTKQCENCGEPFPCYDDDVAPFKKYCPGCDTDDESREIRRDFLEKARKYKAPKTYPTYAAFCDDEEEQAGFKPARVAQWLAENEHFKTDKSSGLLYYGNEETGTWSEDGEIKLEQILSTMLGENNRKSHYVNILHALRGLTYCALQFSRKIAFQNGLLDVVTLELTPFTLEEMALHEIYAKYDKNAVSEDWLEFLKQVVSPEDALTLQEWSGYLLLPDYRFHKLLWIHGEGRNGKGVWQRTMESILGEQNVSSVGLEELDGNHRFAVSQLYHKLFNPCSEPTTNRVLQTAQLKKATGQDLIDAEIKKVQKRLKFHNYAKITVIANKFPKVRDSTTAFRERRLFIKFPNEFIGKDCIPNIERNWLEDPKERSGVLNWMLQGLQRLLVNGYFTVSKTQEETEIAFERASDTISAFLKELAIFDKNLVATRRQAYDLYKEYCDLFGLDQESDKKFTQRLKETPRISVTTVTKPKRERAWQGLGLKTLNEDGSVTDVTHFKQFPLHENPETERINYIEKCVKSVTSVPTLQDQMDMVVSTIKELEAETEIVEKIALKNELQKRYSFPTSLMERLIWKLLREGTIFEPREGYFKKT